jgi:hypothetical protein
MTLLRTIERVIDTLCLQQRMLQTCSTVARDAIQRITASNDAKPIDPRGSVEKTLLEAQRNTRKLHEVLRRKRESANADPRLTDDDGVAAEFTTTIAVVAELHNNLNSLRWAVAEHDADRAKTIREFDSMEDMVAFMKTR